MTETRAGVDPIPATPEAIGAWLGKTMPLVPDLPDLIARDSVDIARTAQARGLDHVWPHDLGCRSLGCWGGWYDPCFDGYEPRQRP